MLNFRGLVRAAEGLSVARAEGNVTRVWSRIGRLIAALAALALMLGIGLAQTADADPFVGAPPASLSVSQRSTVAILSWSAVPEVSGYAVQYAADSAFAAAQQMTTQDTIAVITGLAAGTTYFVRVAAWDPTTGAQGDWGQLVSFITGDPEFALAAPDVTLTTPTTTSITAVWDKVAPKAQYQLAYGKDPQQLAEGKPFTKLSATVGDLARATRYYVSVRAVDAAGEPVTSWSDPTAIETPENLPLKVASFNIKCASCKGKGEKSWAQRKAAVVQTILSQTPDVLGLQEASQGRLHGRRVAQYQDLVNGLGAPYAVTVNRNIGGGAGVDDRIVYNTETVQLLRTGVVTLPKGGKRRYMAWATFRQLSTGKKFLFADTHLEPGKGKKAVRISETKAVISALRRLAAGNDLPTILVGDFNMYKWMGGDGYKPYEMLTSAGFLDPLGNTYRSHSAASTAFVEKRINTNYSTFNDFRRKAPRFSYDNGTQLDFIFVTKMRVSEWETVVDVDGSGRFIGTIPSDHNMVRATVWLP